MADTDPYANGFTAGLPKSPREPMFIEIVGRLGAGFYSRPPPRSSAMPDEVLADPMLRHMHETGEDWK